MNTFGTFFKVSLFGESHGPALGVVLDGILPGLPLCEADFEADLARRKSGAKGSTARRESDLPRLAEPTVPAETQHNSLILVRIDVGHVRIDDRNRCTLGADIRRKSLPREKLPDGLFKFVQR